MTDIGGDPDDQQSMVRFLLYGCDFEVEGLCTGFGHGHYQNTRPDLIHKAVEAYGEVLPNLRKHRPDFPPYERLKSLIKDGHNGDPHKVGPGMDSSTATGGKATMHPTSCARIGRWTAHRCRSARPPTRPGQR